MAKTTSNKPAAQPVPAKPTPVDAKDPHANLDGLQNILFTRVSFTGQEWEAVKNGLAIVRAALPPRQA